MNVPVWLFLWASGVTGAVFVAWMDLRVQIATLKVQVAELQRDIRNGVRG